MKTLHILYSSNRYLSSTTDNIHPPTSQVRSKKEVQHPVKCEERKREVLSGQAISISCNYNASTLTSRHKRLRSRDKRFADRSKVLVEYMSRCNEVQLHRALLMDIMCMS